MENNTENTALLGLKFVIKIGEHKIEITNTCEENDTEMELLVHSLKISVAPGRKVDVVINPELFAFKKLEDNDIFDFYEAVGPARRFFVHMYNVTIAEVVDFILSEKLNNPDSPLFNLPTWRV